MAIKGVFYEITSFAVLIQADKECSSGKKENKERMMFYDEVEENVRELSTILRSGHIPKVYYRSFYVYVPKVRKVIYIDYRSKVVQRAIYDVLNPKMCKTFIKDTYACITGRGQLAAMERLYGWFKDIRTSGEQWYYYKFDVAKFFYRIDHEILMSLLAKKISDKRALDLIRYYVDNKAVPFGMPVDADQATIKVEEMLYDVGIPIGGGLSHMLGNLYLDPLDQFAKRDLKVKKYIRYMDDIILLGTDKELMKEWGRQMSIFLNEKLHLEFNAKTALRPIEVGCEFVGYVIHTDHVILKKQTTLRMKRTMKHLADEYAAGRRSFQEVNKVVQVYISMLKHCNCEEFKQKLFDNFVLARSPKYEEGVIELYAEDYSKAMVVNF